MASNQFMGRKAHTVLWVWRANSHSPLHRVVFLGPSLAEEEVTRVKLNMASAHPVSAPGRKRTSFNVRPYHGFNLWGQKNFIILLPLKSSEFQNYFRWLRVVCWSPVCAWCICVSPEAATLVPQLTAVKWMATAMWGRNTERYVAGDTLGRRTSMPREDCSCGCQCWSRGKLV